jgi:FkbM family methyltransferase
MRSIVPAIKSVANGYLRRFGYQCVRVPTLPHGNDQLSLNSSLTRVIPLCSKINTVIDVGASNGSWSRSVQRFLPSAQYLLIEANKHHEVSLAEYKKQNSRVDFVLAAAGDRVGEINFDASDPFGGLATDLTREEFAKFNLQGNSLMSEDTFIRIPSTTVDEEVSRRKLTPPFFLKLDTHGFEVPILEGASHTIAETALLQIEVYNFDITRGVLRFPEMIRYLEARGLRVVDLCDLSHRSLDGAFWQMDILLIPQTSDVFSVNRYK